MNALEKVEGTTTPVRNGSSSFFMACSATLSIAISLNAVAMKPFQETIRRLALDETREHHGGHRGGSRGVDAIIPSAEKALP